MCQTGPEPDKSFQDCLNRLNTLTDSHVAEAPLLVSRKHAQRVDKIRYGLYVPNFGKGSYAHSLAGLTNDAEDSGWGGFFLWNHRIDERNKQIQIVDPFVALAAIATSTNYSCWNNSYGLGPSSNISSQNGEPFAPQCSSPAFSNVMS